MLNTSRPRQSSAVGNMSKMHIATQTSTLGQSDISNVVKRSQERSSGRRNDIGSAHSTHNRSKAMELDGALMQGGVQNPMTDEAR
jgi:hypothetical protein